MRLLSMTAAAFFGVFAATAQAQAPSTESKIPVEQTVPPVKESIEIGLSTEKIAITSNFVGTDLTIFGALDNADPQIQRQGHYDILVVLDGPPRDEVVRRKSRVFGIWVNTASMEFQGVPASYSLASTRPLQDITDDKTYKQLGIGVDYVPLHAMPGSGTNGQVRTFEKALRELKVRNHLYVQRIGDVQFISQTLFRATLTIPANVPIGTHHARAYLFRNGVFIRETSTSMVIVKSGFENAVYEYAHQHSLFYGLFAVVLGMFTGWFGRIVFRRD
jgi:uncharacterized protein (TIGR02186 family)